MDADAIRAHIERKSAELRQQHPDMTHCDSALSQRREDGKPRYSLYLELRWPNTQVLVTGPVHGDAGTAIDAAFQEARTRIEQYQQYDARVRARADPGGGTEEVHRAARV